MKCKWKFLEEEGVLHIPGRVIRRHIQRFKVIIISFNFRTFHHLIPHGDKDLPDPIQNLLQRMTAAGRKRPARQGDIHFFRFQFPSQGKIFELFHAQGKGFIDAVPHLIGQFSHLRTLLGRKFADSAKNAREFPFFAEDLHPQPFKFWDCLRLGQTGQGLTP